MKSTKRLLSVLLALTMAFTLAVTPAMADEQGEQGTATPTVTVSEDTAKPGEEVTLKVSIANNPGFTSYEWNIVYDRNRLELKSINTSRLVNIDGEDVDTPYVSNVASANINKDNSGNGYTNAASTNGFRRNATLFTLTFGVKADAQAGKAEVKITSNLFAGFWNGEAYEAITANYVAGGVTVEVETTDNPTQGGDSTGGPTTGDSTTGDSTTGDSTTGDSTTGDSTTGDSTTGDSTTGDSTTGDSTTGDSTTGDSTTGDSTTGDSTTGDSTTGDSTTGDSTTGDSTTGDSTTGDSTTGDTTTGGSTTGDSTTGDTTTGDSTTGDSTTGDSTTGDTTTGDSTTGDSTTGDTTTGDSTTGDSTTGDTTTGDTTTGDSTTGDSTTGDTTTGDTTTGDTTTGDTTTGSTTTGDKPTPDEPITYTLTVNNDGNGTAYATPAGSVEAGIEVTLVATPNSNYSFEKWEVTPNTVVIENNKFTMPESDVTVKAIFKKNSEPQPVKYSVTLSGTATGATGAGEYAAGETVSIYAGTKSGYTFDTWTSAEVASITNADKANASFTMPASNVTVTANWTKNGSSGGGGGSSATTYTITVKAAENGSVSADRARAAAGATVTVTVAADEGYKLDTLTVLNESNAKVALTEKSSGKYTFRMPASDVTVEATFKSTVKNFSDVPQGAYYRNAVQWAVENGITEGMDAEHFAPDGICTRAQAVTFLWRASGSPAPKSTEMPFVDVATDSYYYNAVLWGVENGIVKGTSATTFSPDMVCSRAHIVAFLWRSQKSPAVTAANPFTDVNANEYYAGAVLWAVKEEITTGTTATTFSPDSDCTRAQIVTFIYRCMK